MAQHTRILIAESEGFSPLALGILSGLGSVKLADADSRQLRFLAADADVLWVRLRNHIDATLMDAAPRLRIIASPTTGLNHIDTAEAALRGIRVISLRDAREFLQGVRATAEHTIGLMLALLRSIPASVRHVRYGGWNRDLFKGRELYGKTIGVVGYGRLGRIVARYLRAFEACVLASDPHVNEPELEDGVRLVPLHELLQSADIISVHVSLNPGTMNLFGREQFASMRPGSWFINTSRGEIVDENALLDALRTGRLAGAAVDVVAGEHESGRIRSPLITYARRHNNLIVTPHCGGCTAESMEKTEIYLAQQVAATLGSETYADGLTLTAGSVSGGM